MSKLIDDRIKETFSNVFNVPINSIGKNTSAESIPSWDSLKHMNLVFALEDEFDCEFSDEQILQLVNYDRIKNILKKLIDKNKLK